MSRRNSKTEKARRRLENAWKENRYIPQPQPEEYINHIGFIPNDPFFHNAALCATELGNADFAFRTKNQLIDFVENIDFPMKEVISKSGKSFVEVSCYFHTDADCLDYDKKFSEKELKSWGRELNKAKKGTLSGTLNLEKAKEGNITALYLVRHSFIDGEWIKDEKDFKKRNPNYASLNSLWVPLDEVKNLPTGLFTDDEKVYFAKFSETLQPMDEEELDRFFSVSNCDFLKAAYETNEEGEVIIDSFPVMDGTVGFQPRKKRESWLNTFLPFPIQDNGKYLIIGSAPETVNLNTGLTNNFS